MLNQMLRPVPSRPPGPVDPAEALAFVTASLPALDPAAHSAFSLVVLSGEPRSSVPGLSADEVSVALAQARKALRRAAYPLPGSGWCERAERLVSDRLDDALEDFRLLDAHLSNCERCVEHERRVVQTQDALVASFVSTSAQPSFAAPRLARAASGIEGARGAGGSATGGGAPGTRRAAGAAVGLRPRLGRIGRAGVAAHAGGASRS